MCADGVGECVGRTSAIAGAAIGLVASTIATGGYTALAVGGAIAGGIAGLAADLCSLSGSTGQVG
jgi:hypothetical protein